jgi:predicted transcriptional regulator
MSDGQRAAVERSLAQVRRGEIATEAEVEAAFHLFG